MYVCIRLTSSILGIIDLAVFEAAGGRNLGKRIPRTAKPLPSSACTRDNSHREHTHPKECPAFQFEADCDLAGASARLCKG